MYEHIGSFFMLLFASFFTINFFKKIVQEKYQSFSLDPDSCGPNLSPNCLQRLSAVNESLR